MKKDDEKSQQGYGRLEEVIRLISRVLIPIIVLGGGMYLLHLRITGWSLIFGLPITVIGVAFLIFTYDEVVSKRIGEPQPRFFESGPVKCSICGEKTPRVPREWEEDTICPKCKSLKEGKRVKREQVDG